MTEKKKGLGGLDKVLIGCGLGCGAVVLLVLMAGALGTAWVFSTGDQVATEAILGDDSRGVVRLHELAEDEGTQALLNRALTRLEEINREQERESLPPSLRWISDLQGKDENPARGLRMWIPKEMTVSFEPSASGDGVETVVAANPRTMARLVRAMAGLVARDEEGRYRGHPVYGTDKGSALAFLGSTVLWASSRDALHGAIDRVETGGSGRRAPPAAGSIPEGEWDVEGVVGDEEGLVARFLLDEEEEAEAPDTADLRLGFGFDVVSADEIAGRTIVECGDPEAARRWLEVIERGYERKARELAEKGLEMEARPRAEGRRVVTELRLTGIEALIDEALESAFGEG